MANDLNRCEFIGRLGADVGMRYTADGNAVANMSLAVGKQWKDKATNKKNEATTWVRVVAFNKLAEICGEHLKKGSQIYVAGEYRVNKWQDNNGQDRYTTEIIADQMQMLDSKVEVDSNHNSPQAKPVPNGDIDAEDIPF